MEKCHFCESMTDEAWACYGCGQLTCEDCFAPMSPFATDPVTPCLECEGHYESERAEEAEREWQNSELERQRKEKRNAAARRRYWRPENITKRREARAERKRVKAEQAIKNLAEAMRIVGGMMR